MVWSLFFLPPSFFVWFCCISFYFILFTQYTIMISHSMIFVFLLFYDSCICIMFPNWVRPSFPHLSLSLSLRLNLLVSASCLYLCTASFLVCLQIETEIKNSNSNSNSPLGFAFLFISHSQSLQPLYLLFL